MDIAKLDTESDDVNIRGTVSRVYRPRAVSTKYGQKRLTLAELEDDTGEIEMVLWEEQIDAVDEGDEVSISGAYVREWVDHLQLNIPRDGDIEPV